MKAPLPPDEAGRLHALHRYEILDTAPEQGFDDITLMASHICGTPIAIISLVDENRQWFKSSIGITATETSRDIAICAHGILQPDLFIVEDALADERFASNPLVTGNPKIRFYAGAPLITSDGHALGMLCVNDHVPRKLRPDQQAALRALSRQVVALMELRRSNAQLKSAEESLRDAETKFRQLADNISDVFWMTSPDLQTIHYVSPAYEKIWGRTAQSLYANPRQWSEAILPEEREGVLAVFLKLVDEPSASAEFQIVRPDGAVRRIFSRGFQVRDAEGDVIRLAGIATDITQRKRVEEHLFQSQKMETVGKLAGGIAHEFNSIMTAIIGQSELLLTDLPSGDPLRKNAQEIRQIAERAATLTRQLLAYGRKQMLQPRILDLSALIGDMDGMLRHLMGGNVDVRIVPSADLKLVKIDAGQIKQVIMNIALNAADAMPNGGKLTVETANVSLDEEYVRGFPDLKAGEYVLLAISDTGAGISEGVKARLFEPFFTTKGVGKGTGLGLATCHGIIKQSGGHIAVYSESGRGATFKIYLPQVEQPTKALAPRRETAELPRGTEAILVVDDDSALREMSAGLLRRLGYSVLTAANGVEALNLTHQPGTGHIDLLFTDVVMPQMSGKELSDRIQSSHPGTKVVFASAYTENAIVHQGVLDDGVVLLQKPFTPSALALKLREVLDGRS